MSNIDNITKGMGVGPTEPFTTGNGTIVGLGQFGSLTKSNGMTDGTSVATASKNMAEIYNRILLDMAQCLDIACIVGDPAMAPYAISDQLPQSNVEARDIEQNWTPISTLAQAIIRGIYAVRNTADNALEIANQAVTDGGKFSFTGSIQYEKLTNTITADGIGDNTEVGDVIRVTGTVQNNKLFTVESKIDADKVVVNEAHKNGAGPLSLNDETLTSKVELLTKWYNAPLGLGQAWVNVSSVRAIETTYTNNTNRILCTSINGYCPYQSSSLMAHIDGKLVEIGTGIMNSTMQVAPQVPIKSTYSVQREYLTTYVITYWWELR